MKHAVAFVFTALLLFGASVATAADDTPVSDDVIHDQVRLRLAGDTTVQGAAIEVTVKDGAVTLNGKVKTEKAKEKATKLVKKVKGVRSVDNKLVIDHLTP
jgi:osmotically-inducible protein OsmY